MSRRCRIHLDGGDFLEDFMATRKMTGITLVQPDPEVTLKEVPMFTSDEKPIKVNSVLYRVSWSSGYNFSKEGKATIEALRVFFVNNQARTFRTKCARGCEEVFKVADGCNRQPLYASLANAQKVLAKEIHDDIAKCMAKQEAVFRTEQFLHTKKKEVLAMKEADIKVPKEVRL